MYQKISSLKIIGKKFAQAAKILPCKFFHVFKLIFTENQGNFKNSDYTNK